MWADPVVVSLNTRLRNVLTGMANVSQFIDSFWKVLFDYVLCDLWRYAYEVDRLGYWLEAAGFNRLVE